MIIRQAGIQDAARIKDIHTECVRVLCSSFYTPDQIKVWTGGGPNGMKRVVENSPYCIVRETKKGIAGFASLRPDFSIWHLYIDPAIIRQGIGTSLLRNLEDFLINSGHKTVTLESTLYAVPFYKHHGYEDMGKSYVPMQDQQIEVVKMRKDVAQLNGNLDQRI